MKSVMMKICLYWLRFKLRWTFYVFFVYKEDFQYQQRIGQDKCINSLRRRSKRKPID